MRSLHLKIDWIKTHLPRLLLIVSIVGSLLEILSVTVKGPISIIAGNFWLLTTAFYFVTTAFVCAKTLVKDTLKKDFLTLLVFGITGYIVLYGINDFLFGRLNPEAILSEIFYPIQDIWPRADHGYVMEGYVGHPGRQHIIASAPTLLFGPGLLQARIGFTGPFFLGVLILFVGLKSRLKHRRYGNWLSAVIIFSIFSFPELSDWLSQYERLTYQISFIMHAMGWFFLLLEKITWPRCLNLMWTGTMLATSYTAGLAGWALSLVVIGSRILKFIKEQHNKEQALVWFSIGLLILTVGACSFAYRHDFGDRHPLPFDIILRTLPLKIWENYLLGIPPVFFQTGLLSFVWLYHGYAILLWKKNKIHVLITLWSLSVVTASNAILTQNPWDGLIYSRSIIVIPVVMTGMVMVLSKPLERLPKAIQFCLIFLTSVSFSISGFQYFQDKGKAYGQVPENHVTKHVMAIAQKEKIEDQNFACLFVDSKKQHTHTTDYLTYFLPKWQVVHSLTEFLRVDQGLLLTDNPSLWRDKIPSDWKIKSHHRFLVPQGNGYQVIRAYLYVKLPTSQMMNKKPE